MNVPAEPIQVRNCYRAALAAAASRGLRPAHQRPSGSGSNLASPDRTGSPKLGASAIGAFVAVGRIFPGIGKATRLERERKQFGVEPRERDRTGLPKLRARR
jgi:hypothetical protein